MIVSPEAAEDMRRAVEHAATLGSSAVEAWERDLDDALEAVASARASSEAAIARRRVGTSTWAVLYVAEPRRVVVVALVRLRPRSI